MICEPGCSRRSRRRGDDRRGLPGRHPDGQRRRCGLDGALVKRSDIKIEIVTHGQAQDGFWVSSATASRPAPPTWA